VLLGVVLLLVAGTVVVLDQRARSSEGATVLACVRDATGTVGFANRRVDAIAGYVRPSFEARPGPALRRRLLEVVSLSVAPTLPDVRRARDHCAGVDVLWLHHGLRGARRDCLRLLDRDLAYLRAVTADGVRAFDPRSQPAGRCSGTP
jgi:hypothetical protein